MPRSRGRERPNVSETDDDTIPRVLKQLPRWIQWDLTARPNGKKTKVPRVSTADPNAWLPWDRVKDLPRDGEHGIGFVFTGGAKFTVDGKTLQLLAFDLDACVDGHGWTQWTRDLIDTIGETCLFWSPSGMGMHAWVAVYEDDLNAVRPRIGRTSVPILAQAVQGFDKKPGVQLFGLGTAQFITCTGMGNARCTKPKLLDRAGLDRVLEHLGMLTGEGSAALNGAPDLPTSTRPRPPMHWIKGGVQAMPHGEDLIAGRWQGSVGKDKSASEAFHKLVHLVLQAANGHGDLAVEFLLNHTAWGKGLVHDSADPFKYTKESWVARDVARAAHRASASLTGVFEPLGEAEGGATTGSSVPVEPKVPTGRLLDGAQFDVEGTAVQWLVKGLLPSIGVVQFVGEPGQGKTPFALSLAMHVAAGRDSWFGHSIKRPGKVIYLIGEGRGGLARRARAERQRMGLSLDDVRDRLLWSTVPGQLILRPDVQQWHDEIKAVTGGECALIVVDTQNRNFGPGDENTTPDMTAFMANVFALADSLKTMVLLVHHTGHANKDRSRGSSVQPAGVDCYYLITRDGRAVTAVSMKEKDWEKPEPLVGVLLPIELEKDEDGDPVTAITLDDRPPTASEVFEDLDRAMADDKDLLAVARALTVVPRGSSAKQIADAAGVARSTVQRKLDLLVEKELFTRAPEGRACVFTVTQKGRLILTGSERPDRVRKLFE